MSDNASVDGVASAPLPAPSAGTGGGGSLPEQIRTRRGSAIAPPAHWIGQDVAPRTAFVTGASSGLGLALVKAFTQAGFKVRLKIEFLEC